MILNNNIPAMTPKVVHNYLYRIGQEYTGQGVAMELGCWLGATARSLLQGLREAVYTMPFFCYDRWQANEEQVIKAKEQGVAIRNKQDLLPLFLNNIQPIYKNIIARKGNLPERLKTYPGYPIEICIFDAPKTNPTFIECIKALIPYWIPGVTIVGLLDYHWYKSDVHNSKQQKKNKAPVHFIEKYTDSFTLLAEWPDECTCAFFRYEKEIKL